MSVEGVNEKKERQGAEEARGQMNARTELLTADLPNDDDDGVRESDVALVECIRTGSRALLSTTEHSGQIQEVTGEKRKIAIREAASHLRENDHRMC